MDTNRFARPRQYTASAVAGTTLQDEIFLTVLEGVIANPNNCGLNAAAMVEAALEITGTAIVKLEAAGSYTEFADSAPSNYVPPAPTDGQNG